MFITLYESHIQLLNAVSMEFILSILSGGLYGQYCLYQSMKQTYKAMKDVEEQQRILYEEMNMIDQAQKRVIERSRRVLQMK